MRRKNKNNESGLRLREEKRSILVLISSSLELKIIYLIHHNSQCERIYHVKVHKESNQSFSKWGLYWKTEKSVSSKETKFFNIFLHFKMKLFGIKNSLIFFLIQIWDSIEINLFIVHKYCLKKWREG